jgi:glycosyltransferase involved in cell wall biosynthesis
MNSILNQSYQDFEVIILDDCSTDNSREVIENYRSNPKISNIVYNQRNSGSPFVQWNKGILLSRGSLIWIAESDDYCELTFLEETVRKMESYPSAGLVYTQSIERDEISGAESISFEHSPRFKMSFKHSYFEKGLCEITKKLAYENTIPNASAVLFRKSIFEQVGGADETMKLCGDWFIWVKILLATDVYFIAEPLNIFRLTNISVRTRFSKVQTFHERMKILYWMRGNGIKGMGAKEYILLKNLFNSFMLHKLDKPVNMVLADPVMNNKFLKIMLAFAFSIVDRINGKISRIRNIMLTQ